MKKLLTLLLPLLLTGCATLMGDDEERVYIDSEPAQSTFVITDDRGQIAATGTTPQYVTLKKSDGSYFGNIRYTLTLSHVGYNSTFMPVSTRFSHWYTFGNLIFLGVPGWLVVDPFSGGMYTFKQDRFRIVLRPCPGGPYAFMCT